MVSLLNWFEIPVKDMVRAADFYGSVFNFHMHEMEMEGGEMLMVMNEDHQADGALIRHEDRVPSHEGTIIFLDCGDDLQPILDKVESSGGKILTQKTVMDPETGAFAFIEDTEGNKIGLHSAK
jgi:predicted enzyme related to lactoylglutathione lyase